MAGEVVLESEAARRFFKELKNNFSDIVNTKDEYANAISATVFKDIMEHFEKESGPDGKWASWSDAYRQHMESRGKGGNLILQDTGRLRNTFAPTSYRTMRNGILWFNNAKTKGGFPYAAHHDETAAKKRPFMWLSNGAIDKIEQITAAFLIK